MPKIKAKKITIGERITGFLKTGQKADLRGFLNDQFPQDIAEGIENLNDQDKLNCFMLLDLEHAGEVLSELSRESQKEILKTAGSRNIASIISTMDVDDATDIVSELSEEEKEALLKVIPDPIQQAHIKELIHYPSDSAGGRMSTDFLKLRSDMTISIALNYVRRQAAAEKGEIYYLYVVDNTNKLVGVITLRNLIIAPLDDIVANHMGTEVITCKATDDQETVANTISKYDLIAIPIIDENDFLKGIVTIDDVVDILKKETTEDIYQGSGISQIQPDELIHGRANYAFRARFPWLLITLIGESIAALIIAFYDEAIIAAPIAISFMPLLSGLSGNVGGQTATIVVRGLVTGDINLQNTYRHIVHELKIGFLLGGVCAIITGIIAWKLHAMPFLGLIVAFALTCSMISGVLLGTIFPILLQYFKKDPATASSPVITTLLDIFVFTFYLSIISATLKFLR